MKKVAALRLGATLAAAGLLAPSLAGCVAYVPDPGPQHRQYRDRDRDRDGVPNRQDRRPDNPYRY